MTNSVKKVLVTNSKFRSEQDGYVSNLSNKSKMELLDLLRIQENLLKNRIINSLPDKGEKVRNFRDEILQHLKRTEEKEELCQMLLNLNVNDAKKCIDDVEWTKSCRVTSSKDVECLESIDQEETNPFVILATHSGTSFSKKKQIRIENCRNNAHKKTICNGNSNADDIGRTNGTDTNAVNENNCKSDLSETSTVSQSDHKNKNKNKTDDLSSADALNRNDDNIKGENGKKNLPNVDVYAKKLCEKFDGINYLTIQKSKFYTNKPLKFNEIITCHKNYDASAASSPHSKYDGSKLITLEESIVLHQEQTEKLRELEILKATNMLISGSNFKMKQLAHIPLEYRDQNDEFELDDEDENNIERESECSDEID